MRAGDIAEPPAAPPTGHFLDQRHLYFYRERVSEMAYVQAASPRWRGIRNPCYTESEATTSLSFLLYRVEPQIKPEIWVTCEKVFCHKKARREPGGLLFAKLCAFVIIFQN